MATADGMHLISALSASGGSASNHSVGHQVEAGVTTTEFRVVVPWNRSTVVLRIGLSLGDFMRHGVAEGLAGVTLLRAASKA